MISKTYTRKTCSGNLRVVVNRDDNKKFCSLQIYPPAKNNDCGYSYAFALQDLLTFSFKHASDEHEIKVIIKAVSGQYCNACPVSETKHKSCVDGISQILKKEFLDA